MCVCMGLRAVFLSGAVDMTEPQVQTEIACFISEKLGVSANQ